MENAAARQLCKINNRFYRANAESFAQTRAQAWAGWDRICSELERAGVVALAGGQAEKPPTAAVDDGAVGAAQTRAQVAPVGARVAPAGARAVPAGASACAQVAPAAPESAATPPLVLDVACGNLRFERCCANRWGADAVRFTAVDDCEPLASEPLSRMPQVTFHALDVVSWLIDEDEACDACGDAAELGAGGSSQAALRTGGEPCAAGGIPDGDGGETGLGAGGTPAGVCFSGALSQESADAAVCFGFFHHVPSERLRARLLAELVRSVRPGGIVAASFWRFMDDERLARKALADDERARAYFAEGGAVEATRAVALAGDVAPAEDAEPASLFDALEEGDHLLGWQNRPGAFRYCHSFSDAELDRLADAVSAQAQLVCSFCADGRSGALNRYLVFRRL